MGHLVWPSGNGNSIEKGLYVPTNTGRWIEPYLPYSSEILAGIRSSISSDSVKKAVSCSDANPNSLTNRGERQIYRHPKRFSLLFLLFS